MDRGMRTRHGNTRPSLKPRIRKSKQLENHTFEDYIADMIVKTNENLIQVHDNILKVMGATSPRAK